MDNDNEYEDIKEEQKNEEIKSELENGDDDCECEDDDSEEKTQEMENGKVHSYLPGTCEPLYPEDVKKALSKGNKGMIDGNEDIIELPIVIVDGMVLFPGSTVPLRLRSRQWVSYLRQRIDLARHCALNSNEDLFIGVLPTNTDDLVGEIGVLSVITHTHESESQSNEVVVTALGSRRFKVISRMPESPILLCQVLILPEDYLMPPFHVKQILKRPLVKYSGVLGVVSPISINAWKQFWPWDYISKITDIINSCYLYKGLRPLIGTYKCPLEFSYFLAANLPLSLEEKLSLLQLPNTTYRLRSIYTKLHNSLRQNLVLRCSTCAIPISNAEDMFSVAGSEGTTGAYVNEYGIIHQTITVKDINHSYVRYEGTPQTKDSWFPGYAWTISYCSLCRSHLGWKFTPCDAQDKPPFWGFTSSAVTTKEIAITPITNARIQRLRFLTTLMGSNQSNLPSNQLINIQESFNDYIHDLSEHSEYDEEESIS